MDICWRTKNDENPKGKPRVYLSCYGPDWKRCGERIIKQLLSICDCAVYYYPPGARVQPDEEYRFGLERMDLLVVPVTAGLLFKPNRTMDVDVAFAREKHIPILPLLQEDGLVGTFNRRFGQLQFLQEGDSDRTAIPYWEKLEKFLKDVLVGNQLADRIRQAFCARIFLSYRKKDRALAQQLMRLIHEDPQLRDVAIWYDEFLTPGDDFERNISKELENSDLFLLAVTPNVLEPDNYVMTKEYPAASPVLPVLPAQMEPTDREQLKRSYPGIGDPVDAYDKKARTALLHKALQQRLQPDEEPYHHYLMGMAYFSGIDVEKDPERAIALLKAAADEGVLAAAEKLAMLYHLGDRVSRDYPEAKQWVKRMVELAKADYDSAADEDSTYALYRVLQRAILICSGNLDHRAAKVFALQAVTVAQQLCRQYEYSCRLLADSYQAAGQSFAECGDHEKALLYKREAVEQQAVLYETARDMKVRRQTVDRYCDLASTCEELEQLSEAVECYAKALAILEVMAKARKDPELVREQIELYEKLGDILMLLGDKRQAKQYAKQADRLFKTYKNELQKGGVRAGMTAASYYMKRLQTGKAIRLMEKAIAQVQQETQEQDTPMNRMQLAAAYSCLGTLWELKQRDKKARERYLTAIQIYQALAEEFPSPEIRYELIDSYASLGDTYDKTYSFDPEDVFYSDYSLPKRDLQSVEMASGYYAKALLLLEELEGDTVLPEHKRRKAELLEAISRICKALGEKEEAIEFSREYRQLCAELAKELRSDVSYDRYADACFRLAMLTLDRQLMEEACGIWSRLADRNPRYIKKKKEALRLLNL